MERFGAYTVMNSVTPGHPVLFDQETCNGCNACAMQCSSDVLYPNPVKGEPPVVLYPDECWYCGCCVKACPNRDIGAIKMRWPLSLQMRWKRKETGEHFRLGMPDPPPPNPAPPVGGWDA